MAAPLCAACIVLGVMITVGCDDSKQGCSAVTQTGPEELQSERLEAVCDWEDDLPADAIPGAVLFATSGCLSCHTYRGVGSRNLGARDLTRVGRRHSRRFFERFVRNPATFGDNVMPPFRFRRRQMRQLSLFLAASKGAS